MNEKNKIKTLDRSQGTQLQSKENGITLHTVKEVCQITGFTRKQLFDYQKMVPPVELDKSGYKLYDDPALSHLMVIAELRSIDMPLSEIRNIIEGNCDKVSATKRQIEVLEDRERKVKTMLATARRMINSD